MIDRLQETPFICAGGLFSTHEGGMLIFGGENDIRFESERNKKRKREAGKNTTKKIFEKVENRKI